MNAKENDLKTLIIQYTTLLTLVSNKSINGFTGY